jgi:squalene synthase HpnC
MDSVESGNNMALPQVPTKTVNDENFPVASRRIPARLRPHVHAFYLCVRAADDVADSPDLPAEEKTALLAAMDEALQGTRPRDALTEAACDHCASALETGITIEHARHLLQAFQMDVRKQRYRNWSELINYCLYSAAPVGRYLLDLHGEDDTPKKKTDALCIALQILNHLQDCKEDYLDIDRVYIPEDMLRKNGITVEALNASQSSPALRATLNTVLDRTDELILQARGGPALIKERGLRLETEVIIAIAERLSAKLRRQDPVAIRVELSKPEKLLAVVTGIWRGVRRR